MPLTIKQDNFCLAYIETGNASEAYRRAFNASRMKPETITKRASELLSNGDIAGRLAEIRNPVVESARMTLGKHLDDLKELRDKAAEEGKYGPAIQAEIARGKASGFYIDRAELGGPGDFERLTDEELEQRIRDTEHALGIAQETIGRAAGV